MRFPKGKLRARCVNVLGRSGVSVHVHAGCDKCLADASSFSSFTEAPEAVSVTARRSSIGADEAVSEARAPSQASTQTATRLSRHPVFYPSQMAKDGTKDFICFYRPAVTASLEREAARGDVEAQAALGRLYFEGRPESASNTNTDNRSIVSSFTPAVEQEGAVKWLRKAAKQGHTEAKRLLETVLAKAKGVH